MSGKSIYLHALKQKKSTLAGHERSKEKKRQSKNEIIDNLVFEPKNYDLSKSKIIIFDDVITTGRHFKAAQYKIKEKFPSANIVGLFVARKVWNNDSNF